MTEAVAITYREYHQPWTDVVDELRSGGRPASLVRGDEHVRIQVVRSRVHQAALPAALDIGGQQNVGGRSHDLQHAAAVVVFKRRVVVAIPRRGQHFETHAVPCPALAGDAPPRAFGCENQRVKIGQRRKHAVNRESSQHRARATAMVHVVVTDDHAVEPAYSRGAQVRHDDARTAVRAGTEGRSRVVEQRVAAGADHDSKPLADIEHRHPRFTVARAV